MHFADSDESFVLFCRSASILDYSRLIRGITTLDLGIISVSFVPFIFQFFNICSSLKSHVKSK